MVEITIVAAQLLLFQVLHLRIAHPVLKKPESPIRNHRDSSKSGFPSTTGTSAHKKTSCVSSCCLSVQASLTLKNPYDAKPELFVCNSICAMHSISIMDLGLLLTKILKHQVPPRSPISRERCHDSHDEMPPMERTESACLR